MKRLYTIVILAALMIAAPLQAVKHYSCDFETEADRNRWILNPVANKNIYNQIENRWCLGAPGNNGKGGHYGLFISDDGGASAHYHPKGCWVFACDTVSLDHLATGDYSLSFDYLVMSNIASKFDGLYLLWIPVVDPDTGDSIKVRSIPTSAGIPSQYEDYLIKLQPLSNMYFLTGSSTWRQWEVKIPNNRCDGTPHYLAFVWANGANLAQQPGAMIDNIEITDSRSCDKPKNFQLSVQGTAVTLSWTGTAPEYEVSAYSYETDQWWGPKSVIGNQTSFSGLPIGQTDFIVRAKCDDEHYSLKTIDSKLIYYPDQMCVDYLNLDNARCYVNQSSPQSTIDFSDFGQPVAPVDYGPSDIRSRHVIHFDRTETEPRTGGEAKTIPDGELASIRLGNWDNGDQAERIEFSFDVDTINYPVLLLKYMPILEAPDHPDEANPRFKLDVLIGGNSIGRCGMADFNANDVIDQQRSTYTEQFLTEEAEAQGWHITESAISQTSADIIWKEWTTVGVNLKKKEYQGKKLTVRLTTHDCTYIQHSGYAYFTLGCSDGKLKGMKCGAINPTFEAPDGFVYRWAYAYSERYRRPDGSLPEQYVLGHDKFFNAGMQDDSLYVVDCMFVQDSSCFFSLYASTLATNPVAVMSKPRIRKDCQEDKYTVKFDASQSWVQEIDHVKQDTLRSQIYKIEHYEWNVEGLPGGWSDEVSPTFYFPSKGGNYKVSLRTTCGTCDSTVVYLLHLDSLGATRDTMDVYLCDEMRHTGYVWPERPDTLYKDYGLDSVVHVSTVTRCDSIIYLRLLEPHRQFVDTMLLPESLPLEFHGRTYSAAAVDTVPNATCDTAWVLNLEIYESLLASLTQKDFVLCDGDDVLTLVYNITRGRSLRYSYGFTDASLPSAGPIREQQRQGRYELVIPLDPTPYPNYYSGTIHLVDSMPEFSVTLPFTLTVNYASSVLVQRWNDVLAVRNSAHNGGFVFDSVQWYIGDVPIDGATEFNYYTGPDNTLRFGEEYRALLTRQSDGVKLFTCPIVPAPVPTSVTDVPTLVAPSTPLLLRGKGVAEWYDVLGHRYGAAAYDNSTVMAPAVRGIYLLTLTPVDEARRVVRIVVR